MHLPRSSILSGITNPAIYTPDNVITCHCYVTCMGDAHTLCVCAYPSASPYPKSCSKSQYLLRKRNQECPAPTDTSPALLLAATSAASLAQGKSALNMLYFLEWSNLPSFPCSCLLRIGHNHCSHGQTANPQ